MTAGNIVASRVLIVPLWNWNAPREPPDFAGRRVLIVPLWNWNKGDNVDDETKLMCFNRTFMELKLCSKI